MADIRHRVGIKTSPESAKAAVTTRKGITNWWTRDVRETADGRLSFYFGQPEPAATMTVTTVEDTATWHCDQGPTEWVGTTLTFEIRAVNDETIVLFTHAGWREPAEFMHHCSTKWAYHLLGLKTVLEGGPSTAFPDDLAVSSWG
jgi:hypothetical protein